MKLILTILLISSKTVLACPDLAGVYINCHSEGMKLVPPPDEIVINHRLEDEIDIFFKENDGRSQTFIADGQSQEIRSLYPSIYKSDIRAYCKNNQLISVRRKLMLKTGKSQLEKVVFEIDSNLDLRIFMSIKNTDHKANKQQLKCINKLQTF